MSQRKLQAIGYRKTFVDYEDDTEWRLFVCEMEESHLRLRNEDWIASVLDETDKEKWIPILNAYLAECGVRSSVSRRVAANHLLNAVVEKLYDAKEMATRETRERPNILITGTPGTGKSTLCRQVAEKLGFDCMEVGELIRQHGLFTDFDPQYNSHVLDEDKLLDHIEDRMNSEQGGVVLDYHGCDFFPERWFDFVIVLRCNNALLYDRLAARGYGDFKIKENIECEIFGSLLEEARESYPEEAIHEFQSESVDEMNDNIDKVCELVANWRK